MLNASVAPLETALRGRAQGWSEKSLVDRAANHRKFCWWLEQVEHAPLNLEEITADRVRRFLAYCREAA